MFVSVSVNLTHFQDAGAFGERERNPIVVVISFFECESAECLLFLLRTTMTQQSTRTMSPATDLYVPTVRWRTDAQFCGADFGPKTAGLLLQVLWRVVHL